LKDPRTKSRHFSYTQLELLIARDLGRPVYTFFIEGDLLTAFPSELEELSQRQQTFITEFAKDGKNTYKAFGQWQVGAHPSQGLEHVLRNIEFKISVVAGKPCNLPFTSLGTLFKGRDEFLSELRQHLTAEAPVVIKGKRTIHGMGGVGKTRAAIEYAWKHVDDYQALLFVSADTPETLYRNLAGLCGPLVLNLPAQNEKEQEAQVKAALDWIQLHPGWFMIIDNVDTDEASEAVKTLLARLTNGHILITSRISDWAGHVKSLDLDVLSVPACIAFLDERTDERRPKTPEDGKNVAALVQLLDCLALALEQAGAHISASAISYADYIALWQSHRPEVLAWHSDDQMNYPRSLAITYETSVAQLSEGAKELLLVLSWFAPDPIPRNLVESSINPGEQRRHLGEIERLHLARYTSDGVNFTIHRLNQEITRLQQDALGPQALGTAVKWLAKAYFHQPLEFQYWPVLIPLTPHAVNIGSNAIDRNVFGESVNLANRAGMLLTSQAKYRDAEPLFRRCLSVFERDMGKDHPGSAVLLSNLAEVLHQTSQFMDAESLMRRAVAIFENMPDCHPSNLAGALNNLATLLGHTNRVREAESIMRQALALEDADLHENQPRSGRGINNLAQMLHDTNRLAEAEPLMRQALAVDEAALGNDNPTVAIRLNNLAELLRDLGRINEAESLMQRALKIDETFYGQRHPSVAVRLNSLGALLGACGDDKAAEPLLRRALEINEECFGENNAAVGLSLNNLAQLLRANNRLDEAASLMKRALDIEERIHGSRHPYVVAVNSDLAALFYQLNRYEEAEPLMRRALANEEAKPQNQLNRSAGFLNLALTIEALGRPAEAEPLMLRALEIRLQHSSDIGRQYPNLRATINNYGCLLMANGSTNAEAQKTVRDLLEKHGVIL